ncbi:LOW QUALITY PROTEIN: rho guanine nucleotide exchange factor 11 [Bicyclus anynana]|uniref:LOW QUALITY PROTEIN: rho guanine nucleotide exchange factor 11 n=2 Tax=Satyrini TaxID=127320 RepID=A0ABM3LUF5_BICAN|nr:LOW QUALITY PROTEIN: rho guanine nucleotide exchange factor 11 [Bicyclus anynana]
MLGGAGGAASPAGDELLTVTVVRDEHGYGMKVSGDNPVYVQSVKEHGAAWRAGLRSGDRILRVDSVPVHQHTHQQVVHLIRANPSTVLTVQQNSSRHKTPITAPVPVNSEKQRQLEVSKAHTVRLMLEQEQKYIRDLRNELLKVPDVRKQAQLESAEQRCSKLQHEIDTIIAAQPEAVQPPSTPKLTRAKDSLPNTGFLSGLPRSLSNLTGQSLRNLRQARQKQETQPLVRQNSDETNNKRRHVHNNTVPMVPTTCLDNTPPPLPPRSIERPKRIPLSPHSPTISPVNPLAMQKPCTSSPIHKQYYKKPYPMHQSMPPYREEKFRRSSHSLDGELEGPQPNSIALQMSYPLVNVPPPPLQTDNRSAVPILHVRSQSSPEHLDHELPRNQSCLHHTTEKEAWSRGTPPPGTPPPPYPHPAHPSHPAHPAMRTQPCADPQRAIISMEEDDSPASDNSTYSGLFSNLRSVRESKARTAVLINWLLGERRCACASLLLVLTDSYRSAAGVTTHTLRRWAYELQSTFLMPNAVLQLNGVDENMANEIEHVLVNEFDKEELLRNVFRKARRQAKDELARQLSEFQVKRQVGLGTLYGPEDAVLERCDVDKAQELVVVERLMCQRLSAVAAAGPAGSSPDAHNALLAALVAAALCLHCRPSSVAAAAGGARASFLQRDKPYKQRLKQMAKLHPQPYVVRGHHLQLQALTSVGHCHHCDLVIEGLAPQAYVCADCKLRVHRNCARDVEEGCCLDGEHHNNRISRFMDRIHSNQPGLDSSDKKSRKSSGTANFLHMERSFRKMEDETPWEHTLTPAAFQGDSRREGSTDEPSAPDVDVDTSDTTVKEPEKETNWKGASTGARGVNRAESCRERDAPRRGKHRNASDPNRLTAHHNHDLEPGAATAPSGSSSSSSLSSRSNESNTVAADQQASQSDWSEEEEPLAAQWSDSLPAHIRDSIVLSARIRKRQEVIHELIVSEGSHVRWLKVLGVDFLKPLERQPALLPADELRALFPNLPGVRERHARLYSELRTVRNDAQQHVVRIRPVADAMLNTLGDSGYSSCLSKFCRGQRMALDALRERRRKNKELHQFLAGREQLPRCGRLQLRDLLACVWQRLTKYQLLLESILKTVAEDVCDNEECDSADDIAQLKKALTVAKEVLHSVDTAIRTAENEHRLRSIQNKLEVRIPGGVGSGGEFEELRRLDLTAHALRHEGELSLRTDTKKISVLALMLEDSLVLLQREGDKFVLRPLAQPSHSVLLSPLIRWDKVLFRPNAAVRNTFFLMNINGIQMHELSANTANEYVTWVKHIQEAPLARLAETKPSLTPSHQHARSADDSGINVSRNPSDASEKSTTSSAPPDEPCESERERASLERDDASERDKQSLEREESEMDTRAASVDKEDNVDEKPKQTTVGRILIHEGEAAPPLEPSAAVTVLPPPGAVHTAQRAFSHQDRLRRLDEAISNALRAKSAVVAELLGVPPNSFTHLAELAVADTMGQVDICGGVVPSEADSAPDLHQLLLAAQAQANQLTETLSGALALSDASSVAARSGRCDSCRRPRHAPDKCIEPTSDRSAEDAERRAERLRERSEGDASFDMLHDLSTNEPNAVDSVLEDEVGAAGAARLAGRLVGGVCGVQAALAAMLSALPALEHERRSLRAEVATLRDRVDALRHRNGECTPLPVI